MDEAEELRELLRIERLAIAKLRVENESLQETIEEKSSTIRTWEQHAMQWEKETRAVRAQMDGMAEQYASRISSLEEELDVQITRMQRLRVMVDVQEARSMSSLRSSRSSPVEAPGSPTWAPSPLLQPLAESGAAMETEHVEKQDLVLATTRSAAPPVPHEDAAETNQIMHSRISSQSREAILRQTPENPNPSSVKREQARMHMKQPARHGNGGSRPVHQQLPHSMFSPSGAAFVNPYASPYMGARYR